jgi:hypothetical protein
MVWGKLGMAAGEAGLAYKAAHAAAARGSVRLGARGMGGVWMGGPGSPGTAMVRYAGGGSLIRAARPGPRSIFSGMSRSAKYSALGAAAGGMYGAISDDTSVLGGALFGLGAGRYGGAGLRLANRGGARLGLGAHSALAGKRFGLGAYGQMRRDYRSMGAFLGGNKSIQRVGSTLKGWGIGGLGGWARGAGGGY